MCKSELYHALAEPSCPTPKSPRDSELDDNLIAALRAVCAGGHDLETGTGLLHKPDLPPPEAPVVCQVAFQSSMPLMYIANSTKRPE